MKYNEELDALKAKIADLEEQLRIEKMRRRLNEKIIDITEEKYNIPIRKKLAPSSDRPERRVHQGESYIGTLRAG